MPIICFTKYIFHTDVLSYLPIKQPQAFAYLHTAKIKTFRSVTLTHAEGCLGKLHQSRNFLHSLLCSHNCHTNHSSEQNESIPPHISTLLLKDQFEYCTLSCLVLSSSPWSFRYSEQNFAQLHVHTHTHTLISMILKIKHSDCVILPHNRDKALAVHPQQLGTSTCSVILCKQD